MKRAVHDVDLLDLAPLELLHRNPRGWEHTSPMVGRSPEHALIRDEIAVQAAEHVTPAAADGDVRDRDRRLGGIAQRQPGVVAVQRTGEARGRR